MLGSGGLLGTVGDVIDDIVNGGPDSILNLSLTDLDSLLAADLDIGLGGSSLVNVDGTVSLQLPAGGGSNIVFGGMGNDSVSTGAGSDLIYGNEGNDDINAGDGNNTVIGGFGTDDGDDVIFTGSGSDIVYGDQGNDSISSGAGNDTLNGNDGNDFLTGGGGADLYVFEQNSGSDHVVGFSFAEGDRLGLQGQTFTLGSSADGDALLVLSGGGTIELDGLATASFSANFIA